jgi:lipopolysaccharide export system protein LptA
VYSPREIPHKEDVETILRRSLAHPIGTRPLRDLVAGKENVVIVADDNTRLTPTHLIIPILLNEMNAAGIPDSKISVVIALGTHRFMTEEEILKKFGEEVVRRVPVINHPFKDPKELVDLGTTANGTRIQVNKRVYEADFKIGVGSIVPHHIPGFAGGSKIVQPGVCGEQTTADTHLLSVRAKRSYLGILDNPVRVELDIIARKVGLHTILNTVLDKNGEVVAQGAVRVKGSRLRYHNDTGEALLEGPLEVERQGEKPLTGKAGSLRYLLDEDRLWLLGGVTFAQGGRTTRAEKALLQEKEGYAYLYGGVESRDEKGFVRGERVRYALRTGEVVVLSRVAGEFRE